MQTLICDWRLRHKRKLWRLHIDKVEKQQEHNNPGVSVERLVMMNPGDDFSRTLKLKHYYHGWCSKRNVHCDLCLSFDVVPFVIVLLCQLIPYNVTSACVGVIYTYRVLKWTLYYFIVFWVQYIIEECNFNKQKVYNSWKHAYVWYCNQWTGCYC